MRHILLATAVLAPCFLPAICAAGETKKKDFIATDPAKAGPDYKIQGEYQGELDTGDGQAKFGVQVVALGDGKFEGVVYFGGLPGDGWDGGEKQTFKGQTNDDETVLETADGDRGVTTDGKSIAVTDRDGTKIGALKKVVRKSKTLGAKPPAGAIVLFDGKSADAFERGKKTDDNLLMADCETKQKFGDHSLHIEFRTPFKPHARGQGRGNSGVYVQNRYEVQVLDSFGLKGENNECGGVYKIAKPKVNMCYPPLTWQTYDIDFTAARYENGKKVKNARLTVKHNGVVIHDDLELPHGTPGKHPEGDGPDGMYLQGHGNPVVYRNVWVVKK